MKRSRRGYSLIELVVMMVVASAVMVTATVWLVLVLRSEGAGRQHLLLATSRYRLAEQFRRDVHAAVDIDSTEAVAAEGNRLVRLLLPEERTVDYQLVDERIVRDEHYQDQFERRETWRIPPPGSAQVQSAGDEGLLALVIDHGAAPTEETAARSLRIEARLSSDHRFSRPKREQED